MKLNNRGVVSPLIFVYVAIAAILVLFLVVGNLPIKDRLLGGLFPKSNSQAAGAVDLQLVPNAVSVAKDQTFLVDLAIDAKTDQPSGMNVVVKFDPAYVQMTGFQRGFYFDMNAPGFAPAYDNATGIAKAVFLESLGATLATDGTIVFRSGAGIAATMEFKALQATVPTSVIQIDTTYADNYFTAGTQVASLGKTGDQVGAITNSTVTVTNTPAVVKIADFALGAPTSATAGQNFNVTLRAKTPEEANLFAARLNFDPTLLQVVSISTAGSFITQWVNDNSFDNATGQISLIGGVPTPGYKNTALATMATITFKGTSAGAALIGFGANSSIYRNSDNKDILITPVASSTVNITGVAPSPSPSVAPSASPSIAPSPSAAASVAPSPSAAASVAPSPSAGASVAPSPSAAASVAPSPSAAASVAPSPSPSVLACSITSANWVTTTNPVTQGKVVGVNVVGTGNCAGQNVSFTVLEDDNVLGMGGTDPTKNSPPTTKFNSSNTATSNWLAEYQEDPSVIENNVPEYFFRATLGSGATFTSANPQLKVNALGGGAFTEGDFNKDTFVDLADLSIMLSNWAKESDFLDLLDLNLDGIVNAVDWGLMLLILRANNTIAG